MILFTTVTLVQAQLGGDPMFEIIEHVDVLNPESIETCAGCPTFDYRFEIGDTRTNDIRAGLKEYVTLFLDGPQLDSCTFSFSASDCDTVANIPNSLIVQLPLSPGSVTLKVEFEGLGCPCESSEIILDVVEPVRIEHTVLEFESYKPINPVRNEGVIVSYTDSIQEYNPPSRGEIWHVFNKVSAGAFYKTILHPVGVSFARLNIWEGTVAPDTINGIAGTYFDSFTVNQITHLGTPVAPWNNSVYESGATNSHLIDKIDTEGIPAADRVFGAFECKDVISPLSSGSLTWEIPQFRETSVVGVSKEFDNVTQVFIHEGDPRRLKRTVSYVGKAGVYTSKVKVVDPTYMDGYYTDPTQAIVPLCN